MTLDCDTLINGLRSVCTLFTNNLLGNSNVHMTLDYDTVMNGLGSVRTLS